MKDRCPNNSGMKRWATAVAWMVMVLFSSGTASAAGTTASWLRDHLVADWLVAVGGWRTGIGADVRAPSFDVLAGGGTLTLGVEIGHSIGVMTEGRVLAGEHAGGSYYEGQAGVGFYARIGSRVRLGVGPAAGAMHAPGQSATIVGGFILGGFDLFDLRGRLAVILGFQLDVDAMVNASKEIPESTLALTGGLGLRY